MPHISTSAVDEFVETIALFERHFATTLRRVESSLQAAVGQGIKVVRIQCFDSIILSRIFAFSKKVVEKNIAIHGRPDFLYLDEFKRRYVYGSTSFAALDSNEEPLVAFLAETTLYKTVCARPALVHTDLDCQAHTVQMISSRAFNMLSDLLGLAVREECW